MMSLNLPPQAFGIMTGAPQGLRLDGYYIDPKVNYGRGGYGFKYHFYGYNPFDDRVERIELYGSFSNVLGLLKRTLSIHCDLYFESISYHVSFVDAMWRNVTVDLLPSYIMGVIPVFLNLINSVPEDYLDDRTGQILYSRQMGKYHITVLPQN